MAENKASKDMGKKIADALKAQGGVDDLFVDEVSAEDFLSDEENGDALDLGGLSQTGLDLDEPDEDDEDDVPPRKMKILEIEEERPAIRRPKKSFAVESDSTDEEYVPIFKVDQTDIDENPELKLTIDAEDNTDEFEMPNNINVLKRLIAQLPSGVPKQTGAQIIRQTIEALGIPMKSVLQDAQRAKDCLNSSIKDCTFTIQEYKANIRNLEKQSVSYQKQLAKLNDIIGLFVYGEKTIHTSFGDFKKK